MRHDIPMDRRQRPFKGRFRIKVLRILMFMATAALAMLSPSAGFAQEVPEEIEVRFGSKIFTESVILGEMAAHLARSAGAQALHRQDLGGTQVLWSALLRGDIDAYPEYTGTISQEILAGSGVSGEEAIRQAMAERGIRMSQILGFNNTYVIGMKEEVAEQLGIRTISDLRRHPDLRLGFTDEFMARGDGWPTVQARYNLPQQDVRGLNHDLAYRGLDEGSLHAMDLYSTDADIEYYNLRMLEDDLGVFPTYHAVLLYRADLPERAPDVVAALLKLEGLISEAEMVVMNSRTKLGEVEESIVAADFLVEKRIIEDPQVEVESTVARLLRNTRGHLFLVSISLLAAILIAVPLGILAARRPQLGQVILGTAGVIQTIPSLALLVFMIPLLGIGEPPAIMAVFLYSLLPIVRNTYTGLHDVPVGIRESAAALGLPPGATLRLVYLPMASRSILAGIKISAVINVGTATLGALVGAGGYGQPILTGIRLDDAGLILQGAIPAALLALAVQGLFEVAERILVPKGLRLES